MSKCERASERERERENKSFFPILNEIKPLINSNLSDIEPKRRSRRRQLIYFIPLFFKNLLKAAKRSFETSSKFEPRIIVDSKYDFPGDQIRRSSVRLMQLLKLFQNEILGLNPIISHQNLPLSGFVLCHLKQSGQEGMA